MPELITSVIAVQIASGLATQALVGLGKWLYQSNAAQDIRKRLGYDTMHPKVKRVFRIAIEEAGRIEQLDATSVEKFMAVEENRRIISQWIWDPGRVEFTKDQLDSSSAVTIKDRANLNRFIDCLPDAIEEARREVFEPETWAVIQKLTATIRQEHGTTREHMTSESERTRSEISALKKGFAAMWADLRAPTEEIVSEKIEESIRADLDESRRLLNQNRALDALKLAKRCLVKTKDESLSKEARRMAHERVSNCYLSMPHRRSEAICHLKAIASLTDEEDVRIRNEALASLLQEESATGIEQIDAVLASQPHDPSATLIKAHLLLAQGNGERAADLYADVVNTENPRDLHNAGALELQAGLYERARERALQMFEIDSECADAYTLFGMSVVLQRHAQIERGELAITEEVAELLHEAQEHLSCAIERYDEQRLGRLGQAYFNRGATRIWLDDSVGALRDFERAFEIDPNSGATLHNLALLSYELGDTDKGLEYLQRLKAIPEENSEISLLQLESGLLANAGRASDAVSLLEERVENDRTSADDLLLVQLLLARAYDRNLQPSKASELLERLKTDHPDDPRLSIEVGTHAKRRGNLDEAIDAFREALTQASDLLEAKARVFLADALYQRGTDNQHETDLEEAVEIYDELSTPELNDHCLRRLALCLLRLGKFEECIDLCEAAQEGDRISVLTEIEANIYEIYENYNKAAERYKWLAETKGGDVNFFLKYGNCQYLLGQTEKARDAVDLAANHISSDSPYEHHIVSRAYVESGELTKGLHHAYLSLKLGEDKALYHQQYIRLFLFRGKDIEEQEAASDKHIKALQQSIAEYEARFPEAPFIQALRAPEDPGALLNQFRKQLPSLEAIETKEKLFFESDLPVGSLAKATGMSVASTWAALVKHPDSGVASDEGPKELLYQEVEAANSSDAIILDLPPLLTLQHLGLFDILPQAFNSIYLPQAALNELRGTIEKELPSSGVKRVSLRPTDEGISITETPAEVGDVWFERLIRIRDFMTSDRVILIGRSINRDKSIEHVSHPDFVDERYEDLLGRPTAEALIESKIRGLTFYAEDQVVRHIAKSEEVSNFGTRALLQMMYKRQLISKYTYHEAMIGLLRMGHYFPLVDFETILYGAQRDGFLPTKLATAPIRAMGHRSTNRYLLLIFGMRFLTWLWSRVKGRAFVVGKPSLTAQWTWCLFDAIASSEERRDLSYTLHDIMTYHVLPKISVSEHVIDSFKDTFHTWKSRERSI